MTSLRRLKVQATEKQFQAALLEYARIRGWLCYHTYDSRRSAAGFPDLVLVRGGDIIFAELKSKGGKVSPAQKHWLDTLAEAAFLINRVKDQSPGVEVVVWRPNNWPDIEETLR